MNKKLLIVFLISLLLFTVCGCGKASLSTGTETSDNSVLYEGKFDSVIIDTSMIRGDFIVSGSACIPDGYEYLLSSYDRSVSAYRFYYFKLDKNGDSVISSELEKPIYMSEEGLVLSDLCDDLYINYNSDSYETKVSYNDFRFDESGDFSAVCQLFYTVYSSILDSYYSVNSFYFVNWNSDGECISIEKTETDNSYSYLESSSSFSGYDGRSYKITASGISLLDEKGEYASKYFDFLNSGLFSSGFDTVNVLDSDSFSAVYRNYDFKNVLCCFIRNKDSYSGSKPIVLACTELDDELKNDVIKYNLEGNGFKIAVYDYSDRSTSNDPVEGWYLLKTDLDNGFRPDIILNSTGCDQAYNDKLASDKIILDLSGVIKKDEALQSVNFTNLSADLFYSGKAIYAVVPSFEYHTVVGSTDEFSEGTKWGADDFLSYTASNPSYVLFDLDTKEDFLNRYLKYNGSEFVDYKSGSSTFDSDSFVKYLEFMNTLPEDFIESSEIQYSDGVGLYHLGDVICKNLGDMNMYSTMYCRGGYVDLGFPGLKGGSGVIEASRSYMIVADRAYTDECWDFVKYYLGMDYQNSIRTGIPVTVTGFINWKANRDPASAGIITPSYDRDGVIYNVELIDDSGIVYIVDHINSCKKYAFSDYKIERIVSEYANQYFDGKISAQEAASSIDREVENYLAS